MSTRDDNAGDLLDDFQEIPTPTRARPAVKGFLPWHKPRKHYVRTHQWCKAVREMLQSNELRLNGRPLSYLGLPGDDMLDIRSLHDVCRAEDVRLRYLGFNENLDTGSIDGQISNNELLSQGYPNVDGQSSLIMADPLEDLGRQESLAFSTLDDRAPYDVVNFDLCNSITKTAPGVTDSTIQALRQVLSVQRARRAEPWLLFFTTRATRTGLNRDVWRLLLDTISGNENASLDFRSRFRKLIGVEDGQLADAFDLDKEEKKGSEDYDAGFRRTLIVGFCKWLIHFAVGGEPGWIVELIDVGAYNIHSGLDMYSLVFKFTKHVEEASDTTGWTQDQPIGQWFTSRTHGVTEVDLACRLVDKLADVVDIDHRLDSDRALWDQTLREATELMESARYNVDEFIQWVDQGCPPVPAPRRRRRPRRQRRR